ncbi:ABC transporter permease [Fusobacterium animalis]|uniref:ABC transporter permease n=1 Tax=Fusobacterium animalis TaxID=76859 RepID=UPI0030D2F55E
MKNYILKNKIISFLIIILIWEFLSLIYPPVIIPKIDSVLKYLFNIINSPLLIEEIIKTLARMCFGLFLGIFASILCTVIFTKYEIIKGIFLPIIEFLQVIPPITWLVLGIIWLGLGGKPAIMILTISTFPIMTISLMNGIKNFNKNFLQVAQVFQLSNAEEWRYIKFPILYQTFETAFLICFSTGIKLIVMAELLTTNSGIGGQISTARINIETEGVFAWSIILIFIYYGIGGILLWIKRTGYIRKLWFHKLSEKVSTTK